jgi:phage tail sheath protein FI
MVNITGPGAFSTTLPTTGVTNVANSVVTLIGYADKGPTQVKSGNVLPVPTMVSNYAEFASLFSYVANPITGVNTKAISGCTATSSTTVTCSASNLVSVGDVLSSTAGTIPAGTYVTAVTSTTSFKVNNAVTLTSAIVTLSANDTLKYAVKSFFDNGGTSAYIVRDVNPDATAASYTFTNNNATTTQASTWTFDATTQNQQTGYDNPNLIISAASGTPFSGFVVGSLVSFSGVTATGYTGLNTGQWVVSTVASDSKSFGISYISSPLLTRVASTTQTGTSVVITGGKPNTAQNSIKVTAKQEGSLGNNLWVAVFPGTYQNKFNLYVYYNSSYSDSISSTSTLGSVIDAWEDLSMDPTNTRYFANVINSNLITVTDVSTPGVTGYADMPFFTGKWKWTYKVASDLVTPANIVATTGNFTWNISNYLNSYSASPASTEPAVRLGVLTSGSLQGGAVTLGTDGATYRTSQSLVNSLDVVASPMVINWSGNVKTDDVNILLTYAASRLDSFVVIDTKTDGTSLTSILSTTTDTGVASYTSNPSFGAAYYPGIDVRDQLSKTGATKRIPAGAAISAIYVATDTTTGAWKAPAGNAATINNQTAVSVPFISTAELAQIDAASANLNAVRFMSGVGSSGQICVMGARTLDTEATRKYVPIRRTLNYLNSALKTAASFALFAPNDANIRLQLTSVIEKVLNDYWVKGGLAGTTAAQAYYVKCDSTNNTNNTVNLGQLNIEVGVALTKPAEYIIISIGQTNSGYAVTNAV